MYALLTFSLICLSNNNNALQMIDVSELC